jgi:uncharacterized protein
MKTNKEILIDMYAAFSKGDVPFILDALSDTFTWFDPADPAIAAHGGTYHGKAEMGRFFQNLVSVADTILFEIHDYVAEGNKVVAIGKQGFKIKSTGKTGTFDWAMIWEFENGKPVHGRNHYDTARYEALYKS